MKMIKKIIPCVIVMVMILSTVTVAYGAESKIYSTKELKSICDNIINWKKSDQKVSKDSNLFTGEYLTYAGTTNGDWYPIAMNRLGYDDDYNAYLTSLKDYVEKSYKTPQKLSKYKSTEWHRITLSVLACGGNPTEFGKDKDGNSINLIADGTYNRDGLGRQGINGYIWALIALDSNNYSVPSNALNSKESIINSIISAQNSDGGWALTSGDSDVDLTAMALQSLAKNQDYKNVKESVNKALNYLSKSQKNSGGFTSWGTENVESSSQVVIALSALNINAQTDKRFIKGNNTLLSAIMKYKTSDGGFTHSYVNDKDNPTAVAGKSNSMASEQTLLALSSYIRYVNGEKSLYDFTDTISKKSPLTDKDIEKINNLPKDLTTENYGDVLALLEKAQYSKNEKYVSTLKNDKAEIEKIQEKINSINTTINSLYPIDNVKISDKDKIEKVIADYNSLSSYDKTKVSGFDDTERALAVVSEKTRNIIVFAVLTVVAVILILFVVLRIRKRIKKKKEIDFEEE